MSSFALENPNTGRTEETFDRFSDDDRDAVLARVADLYEERIDELADHIGREMGKLTRWGVGEFVNEHLIRVSDQTDAGQSPA